MLARVVLPIPGKSSIKIWPSTNDYKLKRLYQEASLLFLPLIDVTACNTILEAMSSGLAIITNDVGGNPSYLAGTKNILTPPNKYDELIDATIELLNDEMKLETLGGLSRRKSLQYEWSEVAKKLESFYKSGN